MNTNWFDRLARDVARGMSRREAVRLLAGTTAMAVFGSWVRPSRVMGARRGTAHANGCGGTTTSGAENCDGTRTFYRPDCQNPVPKLNYTASCNGCGPEGGVFGTGINAVPNSPLYLADFKPACNTHDVGYGTCNRPKAVTDRKFLNDMYSICGDEYPGEGMFDSILRAECKNSAQNYYKAVSNFGEDAYKEGQAGACDCCDECPGGAAKCNGKCCRKGWICGAKGGCCEPCKNGWITCPDSTGEWAACGFGCCNPATPVCCPHGTPGHTICCPGKCSGTGCG
jgi:Group XII secretory phospholipase A2 precursor (PLA2G12)